MRISAVSIRGFRAIDELDLDFCDEFGKPRNVITMAGPNGSGKTSILYAITNALRGVFGYKGDDVPPPSRDDLRLMPEGTEWSSRSSDARVSVDIAFTEKEEQNIRETLELLGKQPPPALPNRTLTVTWHYPPPFDEKGQRQPAYYADVSPALPNVRSWLSAKLWAIQGWKSRIPGLGERMRSLGGLHFFPQDRDLRNRVGALSASLRFEKDIKSSRDRPTVHDVLDEFSRRFAKTPLEDPNNWESHVKHLYASICSPKKYIGFLYREDTPEGSPVFSDGPLLYPLSHAASGEHVILEYILELCRYGPLNGSIILVDEPEVHLHPLWLRRLYLNLAGFGEGNQFILTTHSPELRQRAAADNALIDLGELGVNK